MRYAGAMRRRYCAAWRSTGILWYCFVPMLLCLWGKGVGVLLCVLSFLAALGRLSCAAVAGGIHRVAASGGQGGIGGLRVPPTPSLDSLLTPLYRRRSAVGLEAAERCVLARRSAVGAKDERVALHFSVAVQVLRRVLAPLVLEVATAWQPPAAKEGQGDCDFPLGPPWILLYPLKRRRSARGMEAAGRRVLTRRSAAGARGVGCFAFFRCLAAFAARSCAAFGFLPYPVKRRRSATGARGAVCR